MAVKTWVGLTTGWNNISNWSPSGVPTSTDDIVFNNSVNCVANLVTTVNSIDFTGYTGTFSASTSGIAITIAGSNDGTATGVSLRFSTGMTLTFNGTFSFTGAAGGYIYCNGKSFLNAISFNNATGIWTIQDALASSAAITLTAGALNINANFTTSGNFVFTAGTINANNGANITCATFQSNNSNVRTLNMGWGTWSLTGTTNAWTIGATNMTLNAQQSRIVFTNTSSGTTPFNGGGLTYYTVEYARGGGGGSLTISGSNTFVNFIDNTSTAAHSIVIAAAATNSFYNFVVRGSAGALVTITRGATGGFIFQKLGRGIICNVDYVAIGTLMTASPANTWYVGANSTSGSGATWIVSAAPSSQSLLGAGGVG